MVLSSFDQENHDRILKEYYEQRGIQKGKFQNLILQVKQNLKRNISTDTIAQFLCVKETTVTKIAETLKEHPEMNDSEIYKFLYESLFSKEKDL